MAYQADQITSLVASGCLWASLLLPEWNAMECTIVKPHSTLIILCAIFSTIIAVSSLLGVDIMTSGLIGAIVITTHVMLAGAYAWDIFYVQFNGVCYPDTFFKGKLAHMILYVINIVGWAAMLRMNFKFSN